MYPTAPAMSLLASGANPPGDPVTAAEARRVLTDHLANGRRVIPLAPCEGFDYSGTGCPGHLAAAEADHG
ncbi:hypothetical protein K5K93_04270 [Stenotrophomonas sp. DR822]|uniref:hypothetical protein n=1 Tax=Stenotrophomonas sp. DR822 TaxID=2871174 RepID=UPI001C950926|nr:hypothetical protein [Stenotrophomonas sp. DR822]QZN81657.1 hypothetical protein K5K93_04270 [Stenotrophomonas sp. DR822]